MPYKDPERRKQYFKEYRIKLGHKPHANVSKKNRRAAGLCHDCGEPVVAGMATCEVHRERNRLMAIESRSKPGSREERARKAQSIRAEAIASTRCAARQKCTNKPVTGQQFCEVHRKDSNDRTSRWKYGKTLEEFVQIQNNRCALCNYEFEGSKTEKLAPVVDHDHHTGYVRGAVHNRCNIGLGMFEDDVELLSSAIRYLEDAIDKRRNV